MRVAAAIAHMSASTRALLEDNVRATLDWLKANPLADIKVCTAGNARKQQRSKEIEALVGHLYCIWRSVHTKLVNE